MMFKPTGSFTVCFFILALFTPALGDACKESLSKYGEMINHDPLFVHKKGYVPPANMHLIDMMDKYIDAIQLIKSDCSAFQMANLVVAADTAFGKGSSENTKCMKQFAPFFTNLFNPENHRYEEVRTASQFGFGNIAKTFKKVSHKAIKHTTKITHTAIH